MIPAHLTLGVRLGITALALTLEALLLQLLVEAAPAMPTTGLAAAVHDVQHWLIRFLVAYAVACVMLFSLGRRGSLASIGASHSGAPIRLEWLIVHGLSLLPFALLSSLLYADKAQLPFIALATLWHLNAVATLISLFAGMAPLAIWARAFRRSGAILLYAIAPALGTVLAIQWSQSLWRPVARLTFWLTVGLLHPFVPNVHSDFGTLVLGTDRFAVEIVGGCSGLEGVGLMLVFCVSWLWFFRREYYFPRALIIVPVAMILIFLLNTVRIAALVLIGDAGFPRIAVLGFHSQAGWIAFNAAAFAVAIVAKHSAWLNRTVTQARVAAPAHNPTAPYLVPLLTILALGMFAHAMSAGFDFLYPLRLIGAAAVLWAYRTHYKSLAWGFSWRAVTVGIALFVVWVAFDRWLGAPRAMPDALEYVSAPARALWIACRALAAIVTVPIAEELAYRGFLMRRLAAAEFESLSFSKVGWPALIIASIIFGITHGSMWLPGILAGLAFGLLAIRTNKIGEAVVAHATVNACIAAYVLFFDQWQMW